ncbi:hypothetical protein [Streptomyces sp. NPDC050738]|uniref:hypothetical protein n=1 Tax=Streptomyces sp. NPDC050738 TaxID=3154744 RepID=UPI0034293D0B
MLGLTTTRRLRAAEARLTEHLTTSPHPVDRTDELWSLLDWSLWGSGIGDVLREQIASAALAGITPTQHDRALHIIATWHETHQPVGRRAYEQQNKRLRSARLGADRWRKEAAAERHRAHLLAEQLVTCTTARPHA